MTSNPAAPVEASSSLSTTIEGTWFVWCRDGMISLTLDELDQAYQRGEVDASSAVFTSGMDGWDTLGNLANLDGAATNGAAAPPEPVSEDPPDAEAQTLVRRSTSVVPYPIRKAAGRLADFNARVRVTHPRLAAAGPWLFGAALSGIFMLSLYELGAASTRPGAHSPSGSTASRTTASAERPLAVTASALPASAPPVSAKAPIEPMAPRETPPETRASSIETLRPVDLRLAAPTRADAPLTRSARAKARAAKKDRAAKARAAKDSAARNGDAHDTRKLAKRSDKHRSTAFD
jgi:hypothetical protein